MSNGKSSTRRNPMYETFASFKVAQLMSHFATLLKLPSFKSYFPRDGTHPILLQFSRSVMSDSATPWTAARQASLSITSSQFTQTHVHQVGDAIQPSHPLSSSSPPAFTLSQHQGLFK